MSCSYTPAPGTAAEKMVRRMRAAPQDWLLSATLAEAAGVHAGVVQPHMAAALHYGLVEKKVAPGPRRRLAWRLAQEASASPAPAISAFCSPTDPAEEDTDMPSDATTPHPSTWSRADDPEPTAAELDPAAAGPSAEQDDEPGFARALFSDGRFFLQSGSDSLELGADEARHAADLPPPGRQGQPRVLWLHRGGRDLGAAAAGALAGTWLGHQDVGDVLATALGGLPLCALEVLRAAAAQPQGASSQALQYSLLLVLATCVALLRTSRLWKSEL